jgi:hypothetical protein
MPLGSPVTNKFSIGTAELRIGPMSIANQLLPSHSVGLIDSATLNVEQESVDLEGGFPKKLVDTAIIRQTASVSASLREYSRKNITTMLGNGAGTATTDIFTTTTGSTAIGTTVNVTSATGIVAGTILTIYNVGKPEEVSIVKVLSVASLVLTLVTLTPTLYIHPAGSPVFASAPVPIGAVSGTNYFSVMLIQKENSTGRPVVWSFWKAAISSGLSLETNAEDFAATDLEIKLLEPAASEYGAGKPLVHLATIIPTHPVGLYAGGGDDSV